MVGSFLAQSSRACDSTTIRQTKRQSHCKQNGPTFKRGSDKHPQFNAHNWSRHSSMQTISPGSTTHKLSQIFSLISLSFVLNTPQSTLHFQPFAAIQPYRFPLHRRINTGEGKSGRRIKVLISNCLVQFHTLLLHGPSSTNQWKGIPPVCCSYRCSWLYHCAHPHPFPNVTSHNALHLFASVCRLLAKVLHLFCFQCFARATLRW